MNRSDVIVIGGGISGLSCACLLERQGCNVTVLEARDRVGGRLCTVEEDGFVTDLGGAYVGPTQDRVKRLAREFDLELYDVYCAGRHVMDLNGKKGSYEGTTPQLSPLALFDLNNLLRQTNEMCKEVPLDAPWDAPRAEEWDSMSVNEWARRTAWTADAHACVNGAIQGVLCAEDKEISLLYWLFYVKAAGGIMRLVDVKNGAQEQKFKNGTRGLYEGLAGRLGDRVILNSAVCAITDMGAYMRVDCKDGSRYESSRVVIACAPILIHKIVFTPPLPSLRSQLNQRMPMGSIIKTTTYYNTAFWRDSGYSGSILCDDGPVFFSYDDWKPGAKPAIMGFVLSKAGRRVSHLSPDERKERICQQYAKQFGTDEALSPIHYCERNWMDEEYSGGCYVGLMGPGTMTELGQTLRKPVGRVHFAGTETATVWMGYMDGAIEAGERAAREALTELGMPPGPGPAEAPPGADWVQRLPTLEQYLPSVEMMMAIIAASLILLLMYTFFS